MCLTINEKMHERDSNGRPRPFIAHEDTPIIKFLKRKQPNPFEIKPILRWEREGGIFWLPKNYFVTPFMETIIEFENDECMLESDFVYHFSEGVWVITKGIHAFTSEAYYFLKMTYEKEFGATYIPFKAIIPKGTEYYFGEYGDVVAKKMIIKNEVVLA